MASQEIKIVNEAGIHARPASMLVLLANKFKEDINIVKNGREINAKSIMGIMSLGVSCGDTLEIISDNNDAVEQLVELIGSGFGE
ncbi:phosphocarrier protein [Orenia metallireducens]|jgi:phosphocarrier protein|uniref:Phosphocarrier protein HPr n=1 Tax=Orenia metallireducens TaxID=1413210 RepID=A0A285GC30_9FIRM|nr:HPr family phosphocarrier protein [Orenia metallireducens]PRX32477.1 phosphocarrier protein [Orenia metallireducens]SNY21140.1 phosphocarrier protein [Orenia metallireducens]